LLQRHTGRIVTRGAHRFRDRSEAGRQLGERLLSLGRPGRAVVLGLPRGGVPVAAEVARALGAPLDVLVARKLGVPGHEELAFGAIARGGVRVLNEDLIHELELTRREVEAIERRERAELERRERSYRNRGPVQALHGATAVVVDDGLATGSTMLAALAAIRAEDPAAVIVAVPVADPEVCALLGEVADEVVCLLMPHPLGAVGLYYEDFSQTADEEVRELLRAAPR
jgi:predicted phosphoribosyltransferase